MNRYVPMPGKDIFTINCNVKSLGVSFPVIITIIENSLEVEKDKELYQFNDLESFLEIFSFPYITTKEVKNLLSRIPYKKQPQPKYNRLQKLIKKLFNL